MLINLWLTPKDNQLSFDLPSIIFKPKQEVCVTSLFIKWKNNVNNPAITLTSSLIDKSICNPTRQLAFVYKKGNSKYLSFTPTHKKYYKIQCLDLKSSFIKLIDLETDKNVENIQFIYLQLEVIDGIQQNIKATQ